MLLTIPGRTVHNSHYLAASFLYQLQTLLGATATSPNVMEGEIIRRKGKEMYLDLESVPRSQAAMFRRIAAEKPPVEEMDLSEISAYTDERYYELTRPYQKLDDLLKEQPYRDNPNWLTVPVDSVTFFRRRVLRIHKDRIADALIAYFDNHDWLIYPEGTIIVAESFDKSGGFVEAEVMRKRGDGFWNFAVYGHGGSLIKESIAFDEEGEFAPDEDGFRVARGCAVCHRMDRLDLSGDPEAPVRAPVRGFFHRLPARVPQIHLGPEYYDHMAFTELTEANARRKDGVFGVYGSLLLSELRSRSRLGTLTEHDRMRYERLRPHYPELLGPMDQPDVVTNSIGMHLIRVPAPKPDTMVGSRTSDPLHRPDQQRHPVQFEHSFLMSMYEVTNAQFRCFRPGHRSPSYRGISLDSEEQPVVNVSYDDAQAFVKWLSSRSAEREAGREYRLPTEEEWEYAARGGDDRRFPWGDEWPPPAGSANIADEANGARFQWGVCQRIPRQLLGHSTGRQILP